jgi:hypothetical protein
MAVMATARMVVTVATVARKWKSHGPLSVGRIHRGSSRL